MVLYENNFICVFMKINEIFSNERKYLRKLRDVHIKLPLFDLPCVVVHQT